MRIFFTGITGLLGRYWMESNPSPDRIEIMGTSLRNHGLNVPGAKIISLPFGEREAYRELISNFKPDVIVHAGGEGNVDEVQRNPSSALFTNFEFPLFLMEQALQIKARFIEFSSNAVYDGRNAPYSESSPMDPVNEYGKIKKQFDLEVRRFPNECLIFRPIVAYGWNYSFGRGNPASTFLPKLKKLDKLAMATDVTENPVYAGDVARALWQSILLGYTGELNVGGGDTQGVNRYEWIRILSETFGFPYDNLSKTLLSAFPGLAPRPPDTRLDIRRLRHDLKIDPVDVVTGASLMKADTARSPFFAAP